MELDTNLSLEVTTKWLSASEERLARATVERYADKLTHLASHLTSCDVVVEKPMKYQDSGNPFRVRVHVTGPGQLDVVVVREAGMHDMHEPMHTVIKDVFRSVFRRVRAEIEVRRGDVKRHDIPPIDESAQPATGLVIRLRRDLGYGFLRTDDGLEVYFHENAVLGGGFADLRLGSEVRFESEPGEDGPQATSVRVISQHGPLHEQRGTIQDPQGWWRDET